MHQPKGPPPKGGPPQGWTPNPDGSGAAMPETRELPSALLDQIEDLRNELVGCEDMLGVAVARADKAEADRDRFRAAMLQADGDYRRQLEQLTKAEGRASRLDARVIAWESASGLVTSAGDPDGLDPARAQKYWEGVEAERDQVRAELADYQRRDSMACESPPPTCGCPGCSYARGEGGV